MGRFSVSKLPGSKVVRDSSGKNGKFTFTNDIAEGHVSKNVMTRIEKCDKLRVSASIVIRM